MKKNDTPDETRDVGYIKLHRRIREHWIWDFNQPVRVLWWLDILMECNHSAQKVSIGYSVYDCGRGQSVKSLVTWSKRWRTNRNTVARFFSMLQREKMLTIENLDNKTTRITVCNYDTYNETRETVGQRWGSVRTSRGQRAVTNNNDKNDNNGKNGDEVVQPPPQLPAVTPVNPLPQTFNSVGQPRVPSRQEVWEAFHRQGGTKEMADKFYDKWESLGWMDGQRAIRNFVPKVTGYITEWRKREQKDQPHQYQNKDDKYSYL